MVRIEGGPMHLTTGGSTPAPERQTRADGQGWIVGRQAELMLLAGAVADIGHRGAAFVVVGEPGVGVTTLLRAAAEQATTANCTVLACAGSEAEAVLPFAALHRLLQPILPLTGQLPPVQRDALQTAFALASGPAPDSFLVALGALNLLTESAVVRPVVAVIDNLQWLDKASTDVLNFLARRVSKVPVVLLSGLREGCSAPFEAPFRQLDLGRLDDASARQLLADTRAPLSPEQLDRVLTVSSGNPLAL